MAAGGSAAWVRLGSARGAAPRGRGRLPVATQARVATFVRVDSQRKISGQVSLRAGELWSNSQANSKLFASQIQ